MTVWVSQPQRDMETGHHSAVMVADTYEELHAAARSAGVPQERYSGYGNICKVRPHYILTTDERLAILNTPGMDCKGVAVILL